MFQVACNGLAWRCSAYAWDWAVAVFAACPFPAPFPQAEGLGGGYAGGGCFAAAGVFRSHSLNVQAAFWVSGSLKRLAWRCLECAWMGRLRIPKLCCRMCRLFLLFQVAL